MQGTMTGKILEAHLIEGRLLPGEEVALGIDQTLLQDATGTMACMEFEALGLDEVKVDLAVQYVDHNMLQFDHRNADDHLFLQTFAARYGIRFSRAGNGICHQVHTERFARPGATLLGADSHTPTSGACGSIAIGAGGLEVALAMAGQPIRMPTPIVVGVHLDGELPPWVASKDLILWLIRKYTVQPRACRPRPLATGVRGVLAQGFARIHRRNLIAQGLVPLYIDADAHDRLEVGDRLAIRGLRDAVTNGAGEVEVQVESKEPFRARLDLSPRERRVVVAGGVLNQLSTERSTRHDRGAP
jgi:aconitase A